MNESISKPKPTKLVKRVLVIWYLSWILSAVHGDVELGLLSQYGEYVGCFTDGCLEGDFNVSFSQDHPLSSPDECTEACLARDYPYAGINQYGSGCSCSCGELCGEPTTDDVICGVPCPGNISYRCGGIGWMSVYKIPWVKISSPPCGNGTTSGHVQPRDIIYIGTIAGLGGIVCCLLGFAVLKRRSCKSSVRRAVAEDKIQDKLGVDPVTDDHMDQRYGETGFSVRAASLAESGSKANVHKTKWTTSPSHASTNKRESQHQYYSIAIRKTPSSEMLDKGSGNGEENSQEMNIDHT